MGLDDASVWVDLEKGAQLPQMNGVFEEPATLEVGACVSRIGGSSFSLEYGMFRSGTDDLVADGSSVVVWLDYGQGKSEQIPEALREALDGLLAKGES